MYVLWLYLIVINAISFIQMSSDKSRARRGARRIPEKTLLLTAAAGGSLGAWLAMRTRRHKTKHAAFSVGLPLFLLVHAAVLIYAFSR